MRSLTLLPIGAFPELAKLARAGHSPVRMVARISTRSIDEIEAELNAFYARRPRPWRAHQKRSRHRRG